MADIFADDIFKDISFIAKSHFNSNLSKWLALVQIGNKSPFGSGNGLAPNMRQAISWPKDGLV